MKKKKKSRVGFVTLLKDGIETRDQPPEMDGSRGTFMNQRVF